MQKTICLGVTGKDLLYSVPGYLYFLYLLFPFRFWGTFVFPNQIEMVVVTVSFACIMLSFSLSKLYQTKTLQLNVIDLLSLIYVIYILCRIKYPIEKEYFFIAFSVVCIYLYFRIFPEKQLTGLLFILPLAGILQMAYEINRFTMPWQNISHITGIFNNTGLFGGFAAMGLVVCSGMLFFTDSGKWYLKYIVLVALSIPLAVQVYASGSRASWLAVLGAILFLLYRQIPKWKLQPNRRLLRYLLALCLLVLFIPFSKYLYDLKKDSADGRILIGKVSMEMVKEAPVFGCGIAGFRAEYMNRQANYFHANPDSPYRMDADDVQTPFNEFLKILIEQGIVGLLLFLFLLYKNLRLSVSSASSAFKKNHISSLLLFILIFGFFSYPFDKLPFVVLFVSFLAVLSQDRNPTYTFRLEKMSRLKIPLLLILCIVPCIIIWNTYNYEKACKIWNSALINYDFNKEESLLKLKEIYPVLENNPVFLTIYGKALSFGSRYPEAIAVLEKAVKRQPLSDSYIELGKSYEAEGFSEKALVCWEQAEQMVPARFVPLFLTMKLHFKNREYGKAQECAGQLLTKKIKIDNPEIDQIKREARDIANFHPPPE